MGNELAAVVYGVLAGGCVAAALAEVRLRQTGKAPGATYPSLWVTLAVLLIVLAAQRLTGDISQVTDYFRLQARSEGWYGERRDLQWAMILAIPPLGIAVLAGTAFWLRRAGKRLLLPAVALVYLLCFALVLLVSLHQVDYVMGRHVGPLTVQGWGYVLGFVLTAFALKNGMARPPGPAASAEPRKQESGRRGANV